MMASKVSSFLSFSSQNMRIKSLAKHLGTSYCFARSICIVTQDNNRIVGASDLIPDIKKGIMSWKRRDDKLKKHQKDKTREFYQVVKSLQKQKISQASSLTRPAFHYFPWLNPILCRSEVQLSRRLEAIETLHEMNIPPHTYSLEMTERLFFWARIMSPEIIFSRIGKELIQSQEKTLDFKRKQKMLFLLEKRLTEKNLNQEKKKEIETLIKETKKNINNTLNTIRRGIEERHQYEEDGEKSHKKRINTLLKPKLKYENILTKLPGVDSDLFEAFNEEIKKRLECHPFFSSLLMPAYKTNLILDFLIKKNGCSTQQIMNGIFIVLYDYEAVTNVFEEIKSNTALFDKDHPFLLSFVVYQMEFKAGFVKRDDMFGAGVFFSWRDLIQTSEEQRSETEKIKTN